MSFESWPTSSAIVSNTDGRSITLGLQVPSHDAPPEIQSWLLNTREWKTSCACPDTTEPLYQKPSLSHLHFRWYEAVAFEFFQFINLGVK
jgi:hypothetical protein